MNWRDGVPCLHQRPLVLDADQGRWGLVIKMPDWPTSVVAIAARALSAPSQGVVAADAACRDSQAHLEIRNRCSFNRREDRLTSCSANERQEVPEQRVLERQLPWRAYPSLSSSRKLTEPRRKVV
jgi:hypothetical protein